MRKAIFFDVDGTLVDTFNGKHEISLAVQKAIRDLQAAGHYVFVATGRPYAFISSMLWDFGFDGFVLSNGAQVIMKDQVVYTDTMDKGFIQDMVQKFDAKNIEYVLEGGHDSYIRPQYNEVYDFCMSLNVSKKLIERTFNAEDIDVYKIEILCKDKDTEAYCKEFMKDYPEYGAYYSISGEFFEFYTKKNNKAKGIEKALEYLGVSIEDSYAFGDGTNDIEMLEAVGCGIAMGNATDEVKSYAKRVTDTVGNDGVAKAIHKWILQDTDIAKEA